MGLLKLFTGAGELFRHLVERGGELDDFIAALYGKPITEIAPGDKFRPPCKPAERDVDGPAQEIGDRARDRHGQKNDRGDQPEGPGLRRFDFRLAQPGQRIGVTDHDL